MKLFEHISDNQFKLCEDKENTFISKIEEQEALQFIRSIVIPYAVKKWNENSPQHWQLTRKDISFNLHRLKRTKNINTTDVIIYSAFVKLPGNRKAHQFRFVTYKDANGKVRSGVATGIWNNNTSDYEIIDEKGNKIVRVYFP